MKKLVLLCLLISPIACAEMLIDVNTNRFYSVPASSDINQDEYGSLVVKIKEKLAPNGAYFTSGGDFTKVILNVSDQDLYLIHFYLKSVGTLTASRLWNDLVQFREEYHIARANNGIRFLLGH